MRVLVTGASGFLGIAIVAVLAEYGHHVTALTRTGRPVPGSHRTLTGDVLDLASLDAAVADVDGVCHLAALVRARESLEEPARYWRTNVGGTVNLLDALARTATRARPKKIVLASTAAVYGHSGRQPVDEEAPLWPGSPYGTSKLAADQAAADVAATGLVGAVSLRAFNIAGGMPGHHDRDTTRLIPKILAVQAGHAGELVVNGDGSAVRDFVHVLDMADAFARALDACEPGEWRPYNVGSGRMTSIRDVLVAAEQVTGRPVPVRHGPAAPEPPVSLADPSRIQNDLDWRPKRSDLPQILTDAWSALPARPPDGQR
ncbi:NAD-dependent epimerase/dehydratase family protein [Sphaerisporangium sp. NPDC051017]|uniref:NAD-dependent epimerase/dehydratase family protein n=1 Tax=Sphaerisporangium sp. NPDC051017 TaxID=3154636 RepID=UPI0034173C33